MPGGDDAGAAHGRVPGADGQGHVSGADGQGRVSAADGQGRVSAADGQGRRAFVVGAGTAALGVLALASACAAGQERDVTGSEPATGMPQPTGTGASGTVLGAADQIPVGGGMIFEVFEVVVTQPTRGDFRGFSAACTHTGCIVTEIADRTINCPCHGSRYHLDGTVAAGPAPRPLDSRAVAIVDGRIVV